MMQSRFMSYMDKPVVYVCRQAGCVTYQLSPGAV